MSDLDLASRLSFFLWGTVPDAELVKLATPFIEKAGLDVESGPALEKVVALEHEKFKLLSEIPGLIELF